MSVIERKPASSTPSQTPPRQASKVSKPNAAAFVSDRRRLSCAASCFVATADRNGSRPRQCRRRRDREPAWLARAPARARRSAVDRSPSIAVRRAAARRFYPRTIDAANDVKLVQSFGVRSPWRRNGSGRYDDRNDRRGSTARAPSTGRRWPRIFRLVDRCLLFPERPGGHRARSRLAGALRQGRSATRTGPAGSSLRLCVANARTDRLAGQNMACR